MLQIQKKFVTFKFCNYHRRMSCWWGKRFTLSRIKSEERNKRQASIQRNAGHILNRTRCFTLSFMFYKHVLYIFIFTSLRYFHIRALRLQLQSRGKKNNLLFKQQWKSSHLQFLFNLSNSNTCSYLSRPKGWYSLSIRYSKYRLDLRGNRTKIFFCFEIKL